MSTEPPSPQPPSYADPEVYAELTGFRGTWRDLWWNEDYLELTAKRFDLGSCALMLDVGTGAGHWGLRLLPHLAKEATFIGLDEKPEFGKYLHERVKARGLDDERVRFQAGRAEALPFDDNSFDLVTCQTVLIHIADVPAVLKEMARVTKPGGLVLAAEPDNRAGKMALINGHPALSQEDLLGIFRFLLLRDGGKMALGEGDDAIGGKLPGLFARAGLEGVAAYTNDRCNMILPPYEDPKMKVLLETELSWAADDISALCGSAHDTRRLVLAGGGSEEDFERGFAAIRSWLRAFEVGVSGKTKNYDAARGYLMYLCGGRVRG